MKKLTKSLYIMSVLALFFKASFVFASLEINEIMYDAEGTDTNNEWIEVYNNGSESVDLSTISVADYDTSWHFHSIVPDTSSTINGGNYAIITTSTKLPDFISNFKSKWPNVNPLFFRASFSLPNESSGLSLSNDKKTTISEVSYSSSDGASGDGNSLQKINGSWRASSPTPGLVNSSNSSSNSGIVTFGGSTAASVDSVPLIKKENQKPVLRVEILTNNMANVGIDLLIDSSVTLGSDVYKVGKLVWNFGDGNTLVQNSFEKFTHRYKYVGEYVVTLSYMSKDNVPLPEATDRIIVTVLDPGVVISSIGNESDFYVELENNSKYEMSLSNWILKNREQTFVIPDGTVLLPNKKLIFGSDVTHFVLNGEYSTSLYKPIGQLAYTYGSRVSKTVNTYRPKSSIVQSSDGKDSGVVDLTKGSLSANSANSSNIKSSPLIILGTILLIIIGIYASYFFMHKKEEHIDSLLDGNDIKIIE